MTMAAAFSHFFFKKIFVDFLKCYKLLIRFSGTIVGVDDFSPQWKDSKWRSLKVNFRWMYLFAISFSVSWIFLYELIFFICFLGSMG